MAELTAPLKEMGWTLGARILMRDVEAIDNLDDDEFRDIVAKRLDDTPDNKIIWKVLRHHSIIDRTAGCLEELAEELEEEVTSRGFNPGHFKAKRLSMVNHRIHQLSVAAERGTGLVPTQDPEQALKILVRQLALAVDAHRLSCIGQNLAPEQHDLALWEVLDEFRLPHHTQEDGGPSLAEMIAAGHWYHPQAVSAK